MSNVVWAILQKTILWFNLNRLLTFYLFMSLQQIQFWWFFFLLLKHFRKNVCLIILNSWKIKFYYINAQIRENNTVLEKECEFIRNSLTCIHFMFFCFYIVSRKWQTNFVEIKKNNFNGKLICYTYRIFGLRRIFILQTNITDGMKKMDMKKIF